MHTTVNWCKVLNLQEKGEHKLLEFIKEMNETAEESTSLEEQINLEFCRYKGEEATYKSGPTSVRYPLLPQVANIFQQPSSVPCKQVFSHAGHVVNAK